VILFAKRYWREIKQILIEKKLDKKYFLSLSGSIFLEKVVLLCIAFVVLVGTYLPIFAGIVNRLIVIPPQFYID